MLRRSALPALFLLLATVLNAQEAARPGRVGERIAALKSAGARFQPVAPFAVEAATPATEALWSAACTRAQVLRLRPDVLQGLRNAAAPAMGLVLPWLDGDLVLDLERVRILTDEFAVIAASTGAPVPHEPGLHYQGVVRGRPGSLAAVSVFAGEVMLLVADDEGQLVMGPLEGDAQKRHVLYRDTDLRASPGHTCATTDAHLPYTTDQMRWHGGMKTTRCVRFWWEVNHNIFLDKGSVANATNYVTGLFNQSAILFTNDGIDVLLNTVYVWDVPSPYTANSSSGRLNQFGSTRTSFTGDLAHLIDYSNYGGVAWLNTLCGSTSHRMAYSGINSTYQNVPTYSWSVEVVTHEQGHNMGSRHTHACVWNGNNTAIDGCGQVAGYPEGSCPQGPLPPSNVGGTIMSYCHLTSSTIKFQNGFGPQPTAVMVNAVNSASCLPVCGTTCDVPGGLAATSITTTTASISWGHTGATSYDLRWRQSPAGSWSTITSAANPYALTGLAQGTTYDVQVRAVCGGNQSAWSGSHTFTTAVPCPDALEPNNTLATAAVVTLPATINALIASSSDVDYYRFTTDQTGTIQIFLGNLAGDYDVRLLNSGGTQLAISEAGGTTSENISYTNAGAGTYHVHVYGWNGAFSATQCYQLQVNLTGAPGCVPPGNPAASGITYNGATLTWSPMQGAQSYGIQWREAGGTWTSVNGITGTSHALTGLAPSTLHEFRVRTACSGGNSLYGATHTFTTLDPPCEVVPTVRVDLKLWLDGPYRASDQLMWDSLRVKGLIPLQEPFTALGLPIDGPGTIGAGVLNTTGPDAIVDWVAVEFRSTTFPHPVLERRAALLQRDGDVVALDGTSTVGGCQPPGSYRIAVRHRNHLACMTADNVALSGTATTIDLRSAATATHGAEARRSRDGTLLLWAGNAMGDVQVKYTGPDNDRDQVLLSLGGELPTNTIVAYSTSDVNLDGRVKYTGSLNDRDPILETIGGSVPTEVRTEQLP